MEPAVSPNGGVFSSCYVDVPFGAAVIITADETTLPSGYVPLVNPLTITAPESMGDGIRDPDVEFLNVRQEQIAQPTEPAGANIPETEPVEEGPEAEQVSARPVAVHAGNCADLGEFVVAPGVAFAPSGPAVGQETAIPVAIGAAGLREVAGSGLVGIAYLAYNAADQTQTDVSIFLAEGLAEDTGSES